MESTSLLGDLSRHQQDLFQKRQVILSFSSFLDLVRESPRRLTRNAPAYLRDTFEHFGTTKTAGSAAGLPRYKLFDLGTEKHVPIVGGEQVHAEIKSLLEAFIRQGQSNKMIVLHGPNGSSKSSTVDTIAHAMQVYSETEAGAVYRFNWIFPTERTATPRIKGESGPIGFGIHEKDTSPASYALLDESQIASRITSELRENPIYLIPMPHREKWLREWIGAAEGKNPEDVEIPSHLLYSGLSKRNQLILENLTAAYEGDLLKVLRHIQVERFFYSRQYRVGVSTVEPQMSVDASEKQLTMDKNIANLPSILHNIRFHEAQGELIEANRGILEFSDLLKRPLEAYKYLLTTVEKGTLTLPSGTANLDIVFFATTNDKHLDSFKTIPDFSSFRGRLEFVTVPYMLQPSQERKIYDADCRAISKTTVIAPHVVDLLCTWAVMTRLKQPDPEHYESQHRALIARLDPRSKIRLYEGQALRPVFKPAEESVLKELNKKIWAESVGMVIYEGRFGASPREVRAILYRAAQRSKNNVLTPMCVFEELERLVKDRTVYEFLQFEPRGKYHDSGLFVRMIQDEFADTFEDELLASMTLVEELQYELLLARYIDNVVAEIKKEKIYNAKTSSSEPPNQALMRDVEKIIGVQGSADRHREGLLSRIGAYKLENPKEKIEIAIVFHDILKKLHDHYFDEKSRVIEANQRAMLSLETDAEKDLTEKEKRLAETTFAELEQRFGYTKESTIQCLRFLISHSKTRKRNTN